ncbi:MAG: hypothetical protein ACRC35_13425 [Angustibacter sp.]
MTGTRAAALAAAVLLARMLDVAVLSRSSWPGGWWTWPGAPADLTLLVVVAIAVLDGSRAGAVAGLLAGLLVDLGPPGSGLLGLTAVAYGLAGAAAGRWHRRGERVIVLGLGAVVTAGLVAGGIRAGEAVVRGALDIAHAPVVIMGGTAADVVGALVVLPLVLRLHRLVVGDPVELVRW